MTTTETVIPMTKPSAQFGKNPNIKRHVPLFRYGKNSLLGSKGWKEGAIIIYDDSSLKIFKEIDGHRKLVKPIQLEDVVLDMAFGKATAKYGQPPIMGNERNFITPENLIAMPETKERKKIHWFAAKDEHNLKEIMQMIAESVAGRVRPPYLGKGAYGRYYNLGENEKWITYWQAQQRAAEGVIDENGDHPYTNKTPNDIVVKPGTPLVWSQPRHDQLMQTPMPHKLGTLRLEHDNLRDEVSSTNETQVVRLIGGRRVKETVPRTPNYQMSPAAPMPNYQMSPAAQTPNYQMIPAKPVSSTPVIVPIHQQGRENGHHSPTYRSEVSTRVAGEPETVTTNISISVPPVKEEFSQHQQREEIVTEHQKTIINVGSTERMMSAVEDAPDTVTYTTTKHSSYHKSTVTTSTE